MLLLLLSFIQVHSNTSGTNILITEVLYDTPSCDSTCEWIELYNPTDQSIDITGWTISDNSATNQLPSTTIPSGGYFIYARDNSGFNSLYGFYPDSGSMTLALGNSGDQLTLKDSIGNIIDFVAWENYASGWSIYASDKSIYRISDSSLSPIDTDTVNDWAVSTDLGNPGSGYSIGDTTAPIITINSPADGDVVSNSIDISFTATDNSGVISSYAIYIDNILVSTSNTYTWDTTTYSDGVHIIKCTANDTSDNMGYDQISVTVDNSSPTSIYSVYYTDPLAGIPTMENFAAQEGNISIGITGLLDSANSSINAALYHLSWQPVIDSLIAAHNRGVTVKLAVHADNINEYQPLIDAGITVHAVNTSYIMHNKFFIVDNLYVWTGSYNPTVTGTLFNANDGIKIRSASLANAYISEFNQLFSNISGKSKVDNNDEIIYEGNNKIEVYFAPKDNGLTRMIELIDSANVSIYISIFYLTENSIYDAIVRARDRGVSIHGVFDYRGWRNYYAEADDIISWGGGVVDANPGVYHHKFMVIDVKIVWTGSTNFSASGFGDNDENSVVIHDPIVASHYIARTESFIADANEYDSNPFAAPRIVTHHYSGYPGSNFITWRPHLNGNTPVDAIREYLVWRWNSTHFELMQELNWAVSYYSDADVTYDTTYYYCVSAVLWNGSETGCSAEFAEIQHPDGSNSQPTIYPSTGHLATFGMDTTSPTVSIVNPISGSTQSGFVDISIKAYDDNYLSTWQIYIDDILVSHSSLYSWDTTAYTDGAHTIKAIVTDDAGNSGTNTITVYIDNSNYIKPNPDYNVKFMTYNIEASGSNPAFIDVLKEENPDIAILVEAGNMDDNGNSSMNDLVVQLNNYFTNEIPYKSAVLFGQGSQYTGIALLSRFSVLSTNLIPIVTLDDGSLYDVSHDFISAQIQIGTNIVNLIGAHLKASTGSSNELKRELAQEGIINYMDSLGSSANIIYAGDLNSFSPEDTGNLAPNGNLGYGPMNMTINSANPHAPTIQSYTDVFRTLNPTDPGYTYYTSPYESRIDFIVVNQNLANLIFNSTVGDTASANLGSDHYSVDTFIDLTSWRPTDTIPPAQVTGLNGNSTIDTVSLHWNANNEPDLSYYKIYRDGINIANTSINSYNDINLTPSTTYSYEVSAVDISGNEGIKSSVFTISTDVNAHLLISEVYYDTVGVDSKEEWIELYNPTNQVLDISGWTIADNNKVYTIPSGTTIQNKSYLVIARDATGYYNLYNKYPDISGLTLFLGNTGDKLTLSDTSATEIDFVAWENYVPGWDITAPTGYSIERINANDTDTVSDWQVVADNGTPGTGNLDTYSIGALSLALATGVVIGKAKK